VGFVASKKIGNAVFRNRAKRLLRAHFINHADILQEGSYVLVAKKSILDETFVTIEKTYLQTLKKCSAINRT